MKKHFNVVGLLLSVFCVSCSGSDGSDGVAGDPGSNGGPGGRGQPGEKGEKGDPGTGGAGSRAGSISGVFPGSAFIGGSEVEVIISGFDTNWDDTTTVDFGGGVAVRSLQVGSPTALLAVIDVGRNSSLGKRDVAVTTGGETLSYVQSFGLEAPTQVEIVGTLAQGSLVTAIIQNLDVRQPFDDTTTGDGFFTPIRYTNLTFTTPVGVLARVGAVTPFSARVTLFVDADSETGVLPLDVISGPANTAKTFSNPEALDIAARTPEALVDGTPAVIDVMAPAQSNLYSFSTPGGVAIIELGLTSTMGAPEVFLLGTSGTFAELTGGGQVTAFGSGSAETWYAMTVDQSGAMGYSASLSLDELAATAAVEGASNDVSGDADALTVPAVVQGAGLSSGTDSDWFSVNVGASDVGKSIYVGTYGMDGLTDTILEVYAPDGTTQLGASGDNNFHETLTSAATTAAGIHFVRIYASSFFDPGHSSYDAYVYVK